MARSCNLCATISQPIQNFLNDPEVQKALGVVNAKKWVDCSMTVGGPFMFSGDIVANFEKNVAEIIDSGVRTLIYNGDCDIMCDWIGSKKWMTELEWKHSLHWSLMPDTGYFVAGAKVGMERSFAGFTFLQLYDSGHMVPRDQPEVALAMIQEFLSPNTRWSLASNSEVLNEDLQTQPWLQLAGAFALVSVCLACWARKVWKQPAGATDYASLE